MATISDLPTIAWSEEDVWVSSRRLPRLLAAFAQEHGPIFKRTVPDGDFAGDYVFMVGPEANRFVFHTGRSHFSHDLGWTPIIGELAGQGLLNMDEPEHSRHRKMWNPAFTNSAMEAYIPVLHRIIRSRTAPWPRHTAVDVYGEARDITFDAAAAALAGFEPGERVDELRELFYFLLHGGADFEAWMRDYLVVQGRLTQILRGLLAERRRRPAGLASSDVIDQMIMARDDEGQALTDEQLLGHLNILLIAGHETTTTLAAWTLFLLAQMPAQLNQLRQEIDDALTGIIPIGDTAATFPVETLRRLPLLDNFVKEVGRLYPPVINVPRGVLRPFTFGGYRIPAGAKVRLSLAAGHLLPDVFAEPDRFDPTRFAPPRREDRQTPYGLVTFGGGARICIGMSFATIEVRALVAHVLRHYELTPLPGQEPAHVGFWTAAVPAGLHVRFKKRTARG